MLVFEGDIDPLVLRQHIVTLFHLHQLRGTIILSDGCWRNRVTVACSKIIELLDLTLIAWFIPALITANHGVQPIQCTIFIMRSLKS